MTRILAIEPDPKRGETLRTLVRQRLKAEVVLATSTDAAIAAMAEKPPTLILLSSVIAPEEDLRLAAHLRQAPALRHVPVLTVPFLLDASNTKAAERQGLLSRLVPQRRLSTAYDFGAVVARIEDAIELARKEASLEAFGCVRPLLIDGESSLQTVDSPHRLVHVASGLDAFCGPRSKRSRARRLTRVDLPWFSSIKLTWGPELQLVNISSSGLLVATGIRLIPGGNTVFEIAGPERDLVVRARVIRTEVSSVDSLGETYLAAAAFERSLDSLLPAGTQLESPDPASLLTELTTRLRDGAARGANPVELRADFEAAIQELVAGCEVRLREAPMAENDGRDAVYFTVPGNNRQTAVLQVTFEPGRRPEPEEFEALKAASLAASDLLEFAEPARHKSLSTTQAPVSGPTMRVARGARVTSIRGLRPTA
jgi:CheY-like chemotaxis protein